MASKRQQSSGREIRDSKRTENGSRGGSEIVIPGAGLRAHWSSTDNRIVFDFERAIYVFDMESSDSTILFESSELNAFAPLWSVDGQTIYFQAIEASGEEGIWSVSAEGGSANKIIAFEGNQFGIGAATLDENNIYMPIRKVESDIWVLELSME